ncbi:hypothetical protein DPMN_047846 [Dreissena polymorpha]|uniref:EGF-like domain-containing protein n=1 Tax=Dreissena polymorpha TaxID=45954 RepID=A0A9D4I298_DREPO|nr:hypothetical protein DPMN_047846 [Dreissena polymorpha]
MSNSLISDSYQTTCSTGCAKQCIWNGKCSPCLDGYRFENCKDRCSEGCFNKTCDQSTAKCKHCCNKGYFGDHCCLPGTFGWSCELKCPTNCFNCTSQIKCVMCKDTFYGQTCLQQCPPNCETCTGSNTCSTCKSGFGGGACQYSCPRNCLTCSSSHQCQNCKEGFYGTTCENDCPTNCKTCTSWNECVSCKTGFGGPFCNIRCSNNCINCSSADTCFTCSEGFSRPDLACTCAYNLCAGSSCNLCANNSYYSDGQTCCPCSGTCKQSLCSSATQCTSGCENGYFGIGCDLKCSDSDRFCGICNGSTYRNFKCEQCIGGYYPYVDGICTLCSKSCFQDTCINSTGECGHGCKPGFWNSKCESKCTPKCSMCGQNDGICEACVSASLYGNECLLNYNDTCVNASCHMNGTCKSGCIADFIGPFCETPCPSNCASKGVENRCSHQTGLCLFGCSAGFTGDD